MVLRKQSLLSAVLSVVLTAMLSFVMLPVTSEVYAADEKPYIVNYVTYCEDRYIEVPYLSVAFNDTGLNYKGDPDLDITLEEEYESIGLKFMGWYCEPSFQEENKVTDDTKYSDIAIDESITQITLYAKIEHKHQNTNYTPWGYSDRLPDIEGDWYLLNDVTLSSADSSGEAAWTVPKGKYGNTTLCLNGHNITFENDDAYNRSVISVPYGASLTITDCSNRPGTISGGNGKYGGGIVVHNGGTLNMEQGIISGNKASYGGGIAVMEGGKCDLTSGTITNNTARTYGGGIYIADKGISNLYSGTITNNTASEYGGGVYLEPLATVNLGSDSASTLKVVDDKVEGKDSDVSIEGSEPWNQIKIGNLGSNSKIGIETRNNPAAFETGLVFTEGLGETDISVFTSNDDRFEVVKEGEGDSAEAALKYKKLTVTFIINGEQYGDKQTVYGGQTATEPTKPDVPGFVEWLLNGKKYDFDTRVTENLTLVARFASDHYHDDHVFTAWESTNSLPTESGNYYLTDNVTLEETYWVEDALDIHICLNGYNITRQGDGSLIDIDGTGGKDPSLAIYDCSEGEQGKITGANDEDGAIVVNYGTFILNGGQITGNAAKGIYGDSSGNIIMNGGSISKNTPCTDFYENILPFGGIWIEDNSKLRMNGGTISDNEGPGIVVQWSTLELGGGQITGNTTTEKDDEGAGIFVSDDSTVRFIGKDKITITGNKCSGEENNLFLSDLEKITFADDCVMNTDSRIGISSEKKPEEDFPVVFTKGLENHAVIENFVTDNTDYHIRKNTDGEAELYYDSDYVKVSFDANGGSGTMKDVSVDSKEDYELPDCGFTPVDGYEFDKWMIGETEYEENAKVTLSEDTVVKAKWKPIEYNITYDLAGGAMKEGASNPEKYTVESETITLTQPVRDCYEFAGWTGSDLEEPSKEVTIPKGTTGDKEYTANWTPISYSITYVLKGGELPDGKSNPDSYTVESERITLVNPVLQGSTFTGWSLDGSGEAETTEMVIEKGSSGDKVFIANWEIHVHSIDSTVAAKEATCEDSGNIEYYVCSCGVAFLNKDGTGEVDLTKNVDEGGVIIPAKGHKWDSGKVTKEPTETSEGVKTYTCTVCGETKTEAIPKAPKKSSEEPSGGSTKTVNTVLLNEMKAKGSNSLVLTWNKIDGADGYDVFFSKCGKNNKVKFTKTIKGNKTFKWTKKGLKKRIAYKARVKAWVMKNGKKTYVKSGLIVHAYTSGGKRTLTNAKSVIVKKSSVSLKAGKTYKITAKVTKLQKGKKLMPKGHVAQIRYISDNKKIATVSKKGKITAKSKGSCKVYVIASDGVYKEVKVTVK